MMMNRTDYLNGMCGVLEAFKADGKTYGYWYDLRESVADYIDKWNGKEPHLFSWFSGRYSAICAILDFYNFEDSYNPDYDFDC